jgi:hypothetical protein
MEKYEDKTVLTLTTDLWCEDNYCISYLCKGLDGYMKMYQKKYYGLPNNCRKKFKRCSCGKLFIKNSNRQKICPECRKSLERERSKISMNKLRNNNVNG